MSASLVGSEMCIRDSPEAVEKRGVFAEVGSEAHTTSTCRRTVPAGQSACLLYTSDAADDM
eukprot:14109701-Alexandrium_andersonii.AAC.1